MCANTISGRLSLHMCKLNKSQKSCWPFSLSASLSVFFGCIRVTAKGHKMDLLGFVSVNGNWWEKMKIFIIPEIWDWFLLLFSHEIASHHKICTQVKHICLSLLLDHQKLDREARICRLLKHPNIGELLAHGVVTGQLKNVSNQNTAACHPVK